MAENGNNNVVQRWVTPALLAVVGASSIGGYQQASLSNEQLVALNASVGEQNRLAELRGSTASKIRALDREVEKLRDIMDLKLDKAAFDSEAKLIRSALTALRGSIDRKADIQVVTENAKNQREIVLAITRSLDTFATIEQVRVLEGRVNALSKRLQP